MALDDAGDGGGKVHVVEVNDEEEVADDVCPLLVAEAADKPTKMTIFSVSYSKKRPPKEPTTLRTPETEFAFLNEIILWVWNGSRYSGLLCMASSSTIYYIIDVLMDLFPGKSITCPTMIGHPISYKMSHIWVVTGWSFLSFFLRNLLLNLFTLLIMIVLGVLAFFVEVFLARGLQLKKIGKVSNILYIKVFLSQVWSMAFLGTTLSPNKLIGCFLILASVCSTMFFAPAKENE